MVVAISIFAVRNGMEAEVRSAFERRPRLVEAAPGVLGLEVFQSGPTFVLFTRWEDEASFREWHGSPEHHRSHAWMPPGLKLDPAGTRLVVGERIELATSEALRRIGATVLEPRSRERIERRGRSNRSRGKPRASSAGGAGKASRPRRS